MVNPENPGNPEGRASEETLRMMQKNQLTFARFIGGGVLMAAVTAGSVTFSTHTLIDRKIDPHRNHEIHAACAEVHANTVEASKKLLVAVTTLETRLNGIDKHHVREGDPH